MFASVVMKHSMVAMLGEIMPAPLTQPPSRTRWSPRSNEIAISFGCVSLVMMAAATSAPFFGPRPCDQAVILRLDAHHRHRQADHAGGANAHFRALETERFGHRIAHRVGVVDALHAGAGVGIAGVGDDRAQVALAQVGLGHAHRCGFHAVGGEGARRTARHVRNKSARDRDGPRRDS